MTDSRSPVRALRAALFAAVCVMAAAMGHSFTSGREVSVPGLLVAFAITAGVAWAAGHRQRGLLTIGGGLLAVQGALHLIYGTAQGSGGHHTGPAPHAAAMDQLATDQAAMDHGATVAALTQPLGSSLSMTAAHLAAALICGLWLARGEAAFFRLAYALGTLAFTPLRLLLAVVRVPGLARSRLPRGRRAPRRHGRGAVLAHTLSRRGPPRAPVPRATAPAPLTVRPRVCPTA
ncbi:hypothetical protein [Streptomyces sp. H27-C3]|uniref:hypothetical protein n=1 Tax=Streptomyces sp. H27-C3 TaxID=3046305 RepID=UPI0024BA5963|nr:hypothetical protein [Streptomyces sp. H27-C3]MDJ0461434.1 hypothetical protein [Streptomyces sp. H27-C3]